MRDILLERHFGPQDKERDEFPLLPFEVPAGIARLELWLDVSDAISADRAGWGEGNIVDIGLFDPRGADFPAGRGFRGWSGSARNEIVIGPYEATPGYLAGPIQPGTWHVLLGLYQLAPQGCRVRVGIRLLPGESGQVEVPLPHPFEAQPVETGARWYRGDLHCHTHHSDGTGTLADLVAAAREQGLDFLAVTEHNTVSHLPIIRQADDTPPLLIPGVEVSTYRGHANVWPVTDWVEFRCRQDDQMGWVRQAVAEAGALFSVNHPKEDGPPWTFGDLFDPDCIEVWSAPWFLSNYQALALWDRLLRRGRRVTAVGGSDKHQGPFKGEVGWYEVGTPTTWVWADELSIPAVVDGLRAGRVFISEGPTGPRLELSARTDGREAVMGQALPARPGDVVALECRVQGAEGSLLRIVSAQRTLQVEVDSEDFVYRPEVVVDGDRYFRPEVVEPPDVPLEEEPSALMVRALGNPVYLPPTG